MRTVRNYPRESMSLLQIVSPAVAGILIATVVARGRDRPRRGHVPDLRRHAGAYPARAQHDPERNSERRLAGSGSRQRDPRRTDLWQHPLIRTLTLLGIGASFSGGALLGLIVVYGVEALGLSADDARIGLIFSAAAAGGLIASLVLPRLSRKYEGALITLYALPVAAVLFCGVALAPTFTASLVLLALWQTANMLVILHGISVRQIITPDHLQGRVNTTARMIALAGTPLGAAAGGVLAEGFGVTTAILLTGLALGQRPPGMALAASGSEPP